MYKVIVGYNFSSLTITVELIIKALGCNVIMKPLEVWETLHYTIVCRRKCWKFTLVKGLPYKLVVEAYQLG